MVHSTKVKTRVKAPATRGKGRPATYPFATMEIDAEFFVDEAGAAKARAAASMLKSAKPDWNYESRKVEGGILIVRKPKEQTHD